MRNKDLAPGQKLAKQIIEKYQPQSVEEMLSALKDIFGWFFK